MLGRPARVCAGDGCCAIGLELSSKKGPPSYPQSQESTVPLVPQAAAYSDVQGPRSVLSSSLPRAARVRKSASSKTWRGSDKSSPGSTVRATPRPECAALVWSLLPSGCPRDPPSALSLFGLQIYLGFPARANQELFRSKPGPTFA